MDTKKAEKQTHKFMFKKFYQLANKFFLADVRLLGHVLRRAVELLSATTDGNFTAINAAVKVSESRPSVSRRKRALAIFLVMRAHDLRFDCNRHVQRIKRLYSAASYEGAEVERERKG